ncbi:MAG: MFS transporter [Clostridiales bacterium]|jgi:GPH family glycoside/pentoside/hexuronide:cation symporter|nr:MFS transporter [Clostridiales bacterium]
MKFNLGEIKTKASDFVTDFREYWTKPPKGRYISYKEVGAYSLGGIGKMLIGMLTVYIGLSATNTFVGSVIGLRPVDLQIMNNILAVFNALFTILRGIIVDNTRTRWGRFRPYIGLMGIPAVALMTIFVFLPFDSMRNYSTKLMLTFIFAVSLSLLSPLLNDTYTDLRTVMSPNTQERSFLIAVSSMIASAAPTVANLFIPTLVGSLGWYTDIRPYRFLFVPLGIIGLFFMFFTMFGTKERVFISKQFKPKIKTLYAVGQVYRNKYWWIRTIAGWTAFLEGGIAALYGWIFTYQLQDPTIQTIVITVTGGASTIAMLTTPFIIKKIGPKNLMIFQNLLNIVCLSLMSAVFWMPLFFFIFNFLSIVVYEFNIVADPVIHAEVKDYTHYQSGRRMDFMFGTAGIIGLPITMLTGMIIPMIHESAGLTTNYDVLFDPAVRNGLFSTLCIVSVIGSAINVVPYLFYDLSENKHRNIIKILRLRNLFEDYVGNDLSPRDIKVCVEEVREARELVSSQKADLAYYKQKLIEAKAASYPEKEQKNAALKEARKQYEDAKKLNLDIDASHLVLEELVKYQKKDGIDYKKLLLAKETLAIGFDGAAKLDEQIYIDAITLPKGETEDEKRFRRHVIRRAKLLLTLKRAILKDGLSEMDTSELDAANNLPETTRQEIAVKFKAVGAAQKKLQKYHSDAEAFMSAQALVKDAEAYAKFPEIEASYEKACLDVEELDRIEKEKNDAAKAAKQADLERIRRERRERRQNKKGGKN